MHIPVEFFVCGGVDNYYNENSLLFKNWEVGREGVEGVIGRVGGVGEVVVGENGVGETVGVAITIVVGADAAGAVAGGVDIVGAVGIVAEFSEKARRHAVAAGAVGEATLGVGEE